MVPNPAYPENFKPYQLFTLIVGGLDKSSKMALNVH